MSTTPVARTAAAHAARQATVETMLDRVREALRQMRRERAAITVAAVARRADVSRTFLYQNAEARTLVAEAATAAGGQRVRDRAHEAANVEASWRERALNAEDALKAAHREIGQQRTTIGGLLGRIRDLEHDLPEDGVQRVLTENTTLKQEIRQLTQDNQRLTERLRSARDNNRFLDKRIADLEGQLMIDPVSEPLHKTDPSTRLPSS